MPRGLRSGPRSARVHRAIEPAPQLSRLAAQAAGAPTPSAALRLVGALRAELEAFERRHVALALAEGATFAAIARDLGLTRQAVHRRFRDLAPPPRPLITSPDAQWVIRHARHEARALGAVEPGLEYVIPAVLGAPDLAAARLLTGAGVTLERARDQIALATSSHRRFRREAASVGLRELLDGSAAAARARDGRRIEVEDLLAAALDDDSGRAAEVLRALGVDSAALRVRLHSRPAG